MTNIDVAIGGAGQSAPDVSPPAKDATLLAAFQKAEISIAWVVDDAYRPASPNDFSKADFDAFLSAVHAAGLNAELADVVGSEHPGYGDLEDEQCEALYTEGERDSPLGQLARELFRARVSKRMALRPLEVRLESLGVIVERRGQVDEEGEFDPGTSPQLVFLDWYLGDDNAKAAIESAKEVARRIYRACAALGEPVIVLMSSSDMVTAAADQFRDESRILRGMFYAVHKPRFADAAERDSHLRLYARSLPAGREIQRMHREIARAGRAAVAALGRQLRELTLSDYAHIQRLSLQDDGQPLGEYVFWLLSAALGQELFGKRLRKTRERLDEITFAEALPTLEQPSARLASVYNSALFDEAPGPLANHPRASRREALTDPLLTLGDVFGSGANADGEMFLIINAQCDLQFAPGADRVMPRDRSILLLPGRARPLAEPLDQRERALPRTELFVHPAQRRVSRRILWYPKRVVSKRYDELGTWLSRRGLKRIARLRLPYALELQQAFATDLMRVGMPVAPPIYRRVPALLQRKDGSTLIDVGETDTWASLVLTRDGQRCVCTLEFVRMCRAQVELRIAEHRRELYTAQEAEAARVSALRDANGGSPMKTTGPGPAPSASEGAGRMASKGPSLSVLQARVESAERLHQKESWFDLLTPFEFHGSATKPISDLPLWVTAGAAPAGARAGDLVLVLSPSPAPDVDPAPTPEEESAGDVGVARSLNAVEEP